MVTHATWKIPRRWSRNIRLQDPIINHHMLHLQHPKIDETLSIITSFTVKIQGKKFPGTPEHVANFMLFVAEEVRTIIAALGILDWRRIRLQ